MNDNCTNPLTEVPWCDRHAVPYDDCGCVNPKTPAATSTGQARFAYRLAKARAGRLLHVTGIGWHVWDGKRWAEDLGSKAATRAVMDVLHRAYNDSFSNPELRNDVFKCQSAGAVAGILTLASALLPLTAEVKELDADPYLLNCANGTLDLKTLSLGTANPADRITKVANADWRGPITGGNLWETFLARVLPDQDVRGFLARYAGLGLCGAVLEHALAILTGTGRNGKGVFYGAVANALGDYASSADPDLFMAREGAHPTGEMDLLGVRWVVVSESDKGRKLAEATVKRLTGGDKMKARRMRQDFVEFTPTHTAALVTNHLPKVSGDDPALWARLRVVPFDIVIPEAEQDKHLPEKLAQPDEADAVLAWLVAGWVDYSKRGGLDEPDAVKVATDAYHADSDAVARFIDERCVVNRDVSANTSRLHDAYRAWAAVEGAETMDTKTFGQALEAKGYPVTRTKAGSVRRGLGVAAQSENEGW